MAVGFPPKPLYPYAIDSDTTLFLVYNSSQSKITTDNPAWSEEIKLKPVDQDRPEVWASNGYANLDGELFYYDAVDSDVYGKVKTLKKCARNIGGEETKYNKTNKDVRGFVIAEHHNQLVGAIIQIQEFLFDINDRIQEIESIPSILDDCGNCPQVDLDFSIVEENPSTGTLINYSVSVEGELDSFTINFGDGTTSTTAASGQHRYRPGCPVDPVATASNDNCSVVQTPIERSFLDPPDEATIRDPLFIPPVEIPDLPNIEIPIIEVPDIDFNFPPIVAPCIEIPEQVIPSFNFNVEFPSNAFNFPSNAFVFPSNIFNFPSNAFVFPSLGFDIPSVISLDGNINIPSIIEFVPDINIPSVIEFASVYIPELIQFASVYIPDFIQFGPHNIPDTINVIDGIPTTINVIDGVPTTINVVDGIPDTIYLVGNIPSLILISCPCPSVISIDWGTPPLLSCEVNVVCPSSAPMAARRAAAKSSSNNQENYLNMSLGASFEEEYSNNLNTTKVRSLDIPQIKLDSYNKNNFAPTHGINIPSTIELTTGNIPEFIELRGQIPSTIDVIGVPKTISLEHNLPEFIDLKFTQGHIPLVYEGPPIPVEVKIGFDKLYENISDNNLQCFTIIPCPAR